MENDQVNNVQLAGSNTIVRVDGYWLRHYAGDFLAAAKQFTPPVNRFSPVPYYLICHSIELSLKSFLFTVGYNKANRKNLNHDLEKALRSAEEKELGSYLHITAGDRILLHNANKLYSKKEFEYFESLEAIYDPHDFEIDALATFALKLFEAIEAPVGATIFK
jgi:hypothetical protein